MCIQYVHTTRHGWILETNYFIIVMVLMCIFYHLEFGKKLKIKIKIWENKSYIKVLKSKILWVVFVECKCLARGRGSTSTMSQTFDKGIIVSPFV